MKRYIIAALLLTTTSAFADNAPFVRQKPQVVIDCEAKHPLPLSPEGRKCHEEFRRLYEQRVQRDLAKHRHDVMQNQPIPSPQ